MAMVLIDGEERESVGATRMHCGDVTRIRFDRPIHVEQGEDLEIEIGETADSDREEAAEGK